MLESAWNLIAAYISAFALLKNLDVEKCIGLALCNEKLYQY